mgnify:CR=1 FL=1
MFFFFFFFYSSRRRHTRLQGDWSSDVCSSDLNKCIVGRNGSNIQGGTSDLDLTANNQCVTLIFTTATKGWQIKTNSTS